MIKKVFDKPKNLKTQKIEIFSVEQPENIIRKLTCMKLINLNTQTKMNTDSCYTCDTICDEYFCHNEKLYCDECHPLRYILNNNCGVCGEVDDDYWTRNGVAHCEKCNAKWCEKWMEDDNVEDDEEEYNPLAGLTAKQIARIERIRMERAEKRVDERDHPNIFPYKKCGDCHERSSCGNYTDANVWQCESCSN